MLNYVYDLETYLNIFVFNGMFEDSNEMHTFEISPRKNQRSQLLSHLNYLQNASAYMVGFNSLQFDYPIIHTLLNEPYTFTETTAYNKAQSIIGSQGYGSNFSSIRLSERAIPQIDLVKINHFDNMMKRTSLKALQVAMRSESVEDLPFDPHTPLTSEQMDILISYGKHDVTETHAFLKRCKHLIAMRKELLDNGILSGDVLNYSDVKIGTEYFIKRLGRNKCFVKGSTPKQSVRTHVALKSVVLPKNQYQTKPFENVAEWFKTQTIEVASTTKPKLHTRLANLDFVFGLGGVHASVERRRYESNQDYIIRDIDVGAMYPSVAIANNLYPEHLGQEFIQVYKALVADRDQYKKGTTMNKVLKLANNGAFGNTNNEFSPFFDPKCTFAITVNGQLQLIQMVELASMIPGVEIIQANTDGMTAYIPRKVLPFFEMWCRIWEEMSGLKFEEVDYSKMLIRDVNNYIAITTKGKVKRKGAYWYPIEEEDYEGVWNKDFSNMSAAKCAELCMIHNWKPEDAIRLITDPFDLLLRYKTPAGATLYLGDKPMLKTVRYYVSTKGQPMKKIAKPKGIIGMYKRKNKITDEYYEKVLREIGSGVWDDRIHNKKKSKYEMVETSIESGRLIKECNHISKFDWSDVDFDYYIQEIKKLLIGDADGKTSV